MKIIMEIPEPKKPQPDATGEIADRSDQQGERRCRECGDPLGDAPCELCVTCELGIAGESEE